MHTGSLTVLLIALCAAGRCLGGDNIYLVGHPALPLTEIEAVEAFLGEKQYAQSLKLVPVDNAPAQNVFLMKVLRMNKARYQTLWAKKAFRDAVNPPMLRQGDDETIEFIRRTPGALGYLRNRPRELRVIAEH